MDWSSERNDLLAAMMKAQRQMADPVKDGHNAHHGNRFPTLESVMAAMRGPLWGADLIMLQPWEVTADGLTTVSTELHHLPSGQWCRVSGQMQAAGKNVAHASAGLSTYMRRYQAMSLFGLAPEDDDGNAAATVAQRKSGRTPMDDLTDACSAAGLDLADVVAFAAAQPKMGDPRGNPAKAAEWLRGKGAAAVRGWLAQQAALAAQEDGEPEPEEHHPSWTAEERSRFFGRTREAFGAHRIDYDDAKAWCAANGKPRPSVMAQEQRDAFVAWLLGKGAGAIAAWCDAQEAAAGGAA